VEVAGSVDRLDEEARAHVTECTRCSSVAAAERALQGLLGEVVPPADEQLEQHILSALPGQRRRWRVLSLLPVAASLMVGLVGAVLLGGVPGSSLLALLPAWSTQGWLALFGLASDWSVVVVATAGAAGTVVPVTAQVTAALLSLGGFAAMLSMARRWRKSVLWRRTD
jgi:hypothetical protein